eukprot:GHVU01139241.1.p1 GENE.GHVU01139241.1~~GHVU01139241.1.p1  ORF type:complete len:537 (+),score=100.60 GHVU01139241.1:274-1884(+)
MSSPKSASQSSGAAYGGTGAGAGVSSSRKKATVSSAAVVDEGDEFPTDPLIRSILHTPLLWNIQIIGRRWEKVIETLILALIFLLCTSVRLFSVLRYESVIHEFDPYFNFRTTRYLAAEGYYEFWNWFDIGSWYPLGRVIGQTLFPGLMTTAATAKYVLGLAGIVVDIKDVCVFTAPIVSGFCAISGYLITKEITNQSGAGLLTGLFLGLSPSYMSRSVAGSYDNEAVAIFALVFSFYTFVRAVRSATVFSALLSAVRYIRLPYLNSRVALKTKLSGSRARGLSITIAIAVFGFLAHVTLMYVYHATWASAAAYSHPSIVLSSRTRSGERVMQDDFREAFYWFRKNTHPDARLMSWWDYGYQSCTMGNRTVLVDNNTWNNTHIATVGKAMASSEEKAYPILQRLDVDYVFVVFGGAVGYGSDDINKFLWMVRIAEGVYPEIRQSDYLNDGRYGAGNDASEVMKQSIMHKMSYHRFSELTGGRDYARNVQVDSSGITLRTLEEVYTTTNWIVRIYKVKPPANRSKVRTRYAAGGGAA